MSADASPTLALIAYAPLIWDPVLARHPRDAPGYDWREHFRDLCARAREVWRAGPPIELRVCGEAERMFIAALADIDPEVFILWAAAQGRPDREQMDFADPHDTHLRPVPARRRAVDRRPPDAYV
jgi:hypothetical protein